METVATASPLLLGSPPKHSLSGPLRPPVSLPAVLNPTTPSTGTSPQRAFALPPIGPSSSSSTPLRVGVLEFRIYNIFAKTSPLTFHLAPPRPTLPLPPPPHPHTHTHTHLFTSLSLSLSLSNSLSLSQTLKLSLSLSNSLSLKLSQTLSNSLKLSQTLSLSNSLKLSQTLSNSLKLSQTLSNSLKLSQTHTRAKTAAGGGRQRFSSRERFEHRRQKNKGGSGQGQGGEGQRGQRRPAAAPTEPSRPHSDKRGSSGSRPAASLDKSGSAGPHAARVNGAAPDKTERAKPAAPSSKSSSQTPSASGPSTHQHQRGKTSMLFGKNDDPTPGAKAPKTVGKRNTREVKVMTALSFEDLNIADRLRETLQTMNLNRLTLPQQHATPLLLQHCDVMLKSPTGTGKTLAYAIPIVQDLQGLQHKVERSDGPLAIVLTPTRELAQQSLEVIQQLLKSFNWIVPGAITGGEKKKAEKARLRKGINILVATPGRMMDHIRTTKALQLKSVRWLILDEADRLLDSGFEQTVKDIVGALNQARAKTNKAMRRTNALVSATLTPKVLRLAKDITTDTYFVDTTSETEAKRVYKLKNLSAPELTEESDDKDKPEDESKTAPKASTAEPKAPASQVSTVAEVDEADVIMGAGDDAEARVYISTKLTQYYTVVPPKLRLVAMLAYLRKTCIKNKALVFVQSRDEAAFYAELFTKLQQPKEGAGFSADRILTGVELYFLHGGMEQKDRTASYRAFCKATHGALICTDVAARGLDIPRVSGVLQTSCAPTVADHVHRVGRTARLEAGGEATLFVLPTELEYLQVLEKEQLSLTALDVMDLLTSLTLHRGDRDVTKQVASRVQMACEENTTQEAMHTRAVAAFTAYVRAYATYPSAMKGIFHVKHLHLGHLAKSFALREAPQGLQGAGGKGASKAAQAKKSKLTAKQKMMQNAKRVTAAASDEFSGGFAGAGARAPKRRRGMGQ
ncbi:uncharacterized protein MONBRDRAFT_33876 [Monosiga brevicollis MX1]|uniref:ATP-dependent RNA helicase n=1 Tax=Monosiga brevicollis TaxID=81824 RepID=A9V840_MONBE|nr:uncharacterized protein MONBRDRAFT_33876 [Monosiga brevicollis MX1]EDQ86203.1 predicted protein [Monosiga brevicollis MX1]|eukprot:XP_001748873.1 hypothetical protein [Monosiga brevicollis MX1]